MSRHTRADVDPYPSNALTDRAAAGHAHADGDGDPAGTQRDARTADAHGDRDLAACNADHDALPHPVANQHPNPCAG
jgi:hypothetical protein